jgi:hypothetical protein
VCRAPSKYCTAIFNSVGGVTCDPPAKIFLPVDPDMAGINLLVKKIIPTM